MTFSGAIENGDISPLKNIIFENYLCYWFVNNKTHNFLQILVK